MSKKLLLIIIFPLAILFSQQQSPTPDPKATVTYGNTRFTILTPRFIRLEWSEDGIFEDRASLVFVNRRLPVPEYKKYISNDWLVIQTSTLTIRYKINSGKFKQDNLEIHIKIDNDSTIIWKPGMKNSLNLGGTVRTLDGVKGEIKLEPGLLSRDGWTLIDDSSTPLFDNSEWNWVIPRPEKEFQDWYFIAYGSNYKMALNDFIKVAGKIPIPPKYVFGYWWSKYWAYSDAEFKKLINEFEEFGIPIDVLVVDMDWHQTFGLRWKKRVLDQAGQMLGWTGYTWNRILFPDPKGFLKWCKSKGLKITLNLHPASGIQPHEEIYPTFAKTMGVDPSTKKYIPFNITNKKFAENYFNIVLRPLEKMGVDFWWIDWQQWDTTSIKGLNPLLWINYTFFTDMERNTNKRPLILSRWGGLGNHRYQIGFSGDVITDWSSLQFQPYFTATAANVCFGYWSHDIGGHLPGPVEPELYTRWIQWGAFSPILRTHATKNANAERRIWVFPYQNFKAMKKAILLRYSLIPYIYTCARKTFETGVSFIHPLYYDYPEYQEAFDLKDQFMFGDEITVAPVLTPIPQDIGLAQRKIWIPPGEWIEMHSGKILKGPKIIERKFSLDEIPIYIKRGSIIPMQPETTKASTAFVDPIIISIFYPADSGETQIYEDDGLTNNYIKGEYALSKIKYIKNNDEIKITILPTIGKYNGIKSKRSYIIKLYGVLPPENVTINSGNVSKKLNWNFNGDEICLYVETDKLNIREKNIITIKFNKFPEDEIIDEFPGKLKRLKEAMDILNHLWPDDWSPDLMIQLAQTGNRISLRPENAYDELKFFNENLPKLPKIINSLEGDRKIILKTLIYLNDIIKTK